MADQIARGEDFERKGEKKLSSWGLFGSNSKYEDAADLFDKAANSFNQRDREIEIKATLRRIIVKSALIPWKTLICITSNVYPTVVLSGSMELGFQKTDVDKLVIAALELEILLPGIPMIEITCSSLVSVVTDSSNFGTLLTSYFSPSRRIGRKYMTHPEFISTIGKLQWFILRPYLSLLPKVGSGVTLDECTTGKIGSNGLNGFSISWGGLFQVDVLKALPQTCLTFYRPKALQIHLVTTVDASEFYQYCKYRCPFGQSKHYDWKDLIAGCLQCLLDPETVIDIFKMELTNEKDVNPNRREILADSLAEVSEECKLYFDTLFHSISYLDRFLSTNALNRQRLRLLRLLGVMNLITTIIGFAMSASFIEFVCIRLLCERFRGVESWQMIENDSGIDLEQSERLHKVLEFVSTVHDLCAVLGMIVHQHILALKEDKKQRLHKVQTLRYQYDDEDAFQPVDHRVGLRQILRRTPDSGYELEELATQLIDLWNLMDAPQEERSLFDPVTHNISGAVDEVTIPGALALDLIEQETEFHYLAGLKLYDIVTAG
ncbi:hypothetical protein C3L33_03166, partial [Rhododendron williamsianum]